MFRFPIYGAENGMIDEEHLARCDREIAEIQARPDVVAGTCRAYLAAMGVNDWTVERDLIERERLRLLYEQFQTTPCADR